VLLVYHPLDTLLETVVLLLALLGVWSLSPDRAWRAAPPPLSAAPAAGALELVARVLPPIGILVGVYLFWAGADVPGGAFQGGAVLAAMWLLVLGAGVRPPPAAGGCASSSSSAHGGHSGNPTMTPLVRDLISDDTILIPINPVERPGTPRSAAEILNRLNEVSFNAVLLKELRIIAMPRQVADPDRAGLM